MLNLFSDNIINEYWSFYNVFNRNFNFSFNNLFIRNWFLNDVFNVDRFFNNNIDIFVNWNFNRNFYNSFNNFFNWDWSLNNVFNLSFDNSFNRNINNFINININFSFNDIINVDRLFGYMISMNIFNLSW